MKKQLILPFFFFCGLLASLAQHAFKNDSLYKTMYAKELCVFLEKYPDAVLLDVRSPGEFSDTSRFTGLNHGHLKGAINLNVDDILKDSSLMDRYKNKTVVLYCSHSQRSRKVSKLLSEKGFNSFYNLNGGMSSLNQLTEKEFPCKKEWILSSLPYTNLSFVETAAMLRNQKGMLIIDIRTPAQFNSTDTALSQNIGRIKGAINIPFDEFKQHIGELTKYKQKSVLVYGMSGDGNSARMAIELKENGFTKVYQLLGGINSFIASQENTSFIENASLYHLVDAEQTLELLRTKKELVIYDTRSNEEYDNQSITKAYHNLGRIKNAVHVQDFQSQTLPADKNTAILVYGNQDAFQFSKLLAGKGYKQIYLLSNFYGFVWSSFNVESCKEIRTFLVNHQGLY